MSTVRLLYSIFILTAAIWSALVVVISLLVDKPFLFIPTLIVAPSDLADRAEVLRLSFSTSFAYFAFLHIFGADKRVSSGHVLVSILTSLTVIGGIKLLTAESYANETVFIIVFGLTATMVFLATRPKVRRYFRNR